MLNFQRLVYIKILVFDKGVIYFLRVFGLLDFASFFMQRRIGNLGRSGIGKITKKIIELG